MVIREQNIQVIKIRFSSMVISCALSIYQDVVTISITTMIISCDPDDQNVIDHVNICDYHLYIIT